MFLYSLYLNVYIYILNSHFVMASFGILSNIFLSYNNISYCMDM